MPAASHPERCAVKAGAGSVVIQKAADNNTAALQQMLTNNENLPSVALEISRNIDATGRSNGSVSQTIILSNAKPVLRLLIMAAAVCLLKPLEPRLRRK